MKRVSKQTTGGRGKPIKAEGAAAPVRSRTQRHPDDMFDDELQRYEGIMSEEEVEKIKLTQKEKKSLQKELRADRARLRKESDERVKHGKKILADLRSLTRRR